MSTANAFDVPKTSNAYEAIGMTIRRFDLFDIALMKLADSLEKATSDPECFYALLIIAWIGLDHANFANFVVDKKEQAGKAYYDAIIACLEVRPPVKAGSNILRMLNCMMSSRMQ